MAGSGLFAPAGATVEIGLTDESNNAELIKCTAGNMPSTGAGYAVGCIGIATDTGAIYTNLGSATAASFSAVTAGVSYTLPLAVTDSTSTTTTSLALTQNTVTTGAGLTQSLNALTTGYGHSITHTTTVISGGGSLLNLSSTSADTTTTSGALLTLTSTSGIASTSVLGTFATTTGKSVSLVSNALTTGNLLILSATAATSASVVSITGGGANMLTAGIIASLTMGAATVGSGLTIANTGAYTDTAASILAITASTASTTGNILGITTISSRAIMVGRVITTPAFQVDCSTASQVAGIKITGAVTGGTPTITAIDSGAAANIDIEAKGAGNISIGNTSTGILAYGRTCNGIVIGGVVNATFATQSITPTAANLIGGLITHTSTTGAGTLTLPTGTQMSTAVSGVTTGDSFWTDYANIGTQTVTITAAASFTITGTAAVPSGKNAQLYSVCTGANTWVCNITLSA